MKRFRFQSLQVRLVVRLASLYIIATVIATSVLIYGAYDTASSLNDRELNGRAEDLAHAVSRDGAGQTRLSLPARLASAYADSRTTSLRFGTRVVTYLPHLLLNSAPKSRNGRSPKTIQAISISLISARGNITA